jgi:pyruvate dehydrogenase E2 component (dihydrolipoamide acetyltransferase)
MATPITMPKLGLTMKRGKVVKWHKGEGEHVEEGELLVVVMSKKITYEIQAPAAGTVRILVPSKEERDVAEPIGFILKPEETIPEDYEAPAHAGPTNELTATGAGQPARRAPEAAVPQPLPSDVRASPAARRLARELGVDMAAVAQASGSGPIQESDVREFHQRQKAVAEKEPEPEAIRSSPAARRLAKELGLSVSDVARAMKTGRPVAESDVRRLYESRTAAPATPLARRMAKEEGLDLSRIAGTGPGGKVTEEDVLAALEAPVGARTLPFTGMREAIAESMMESLHSTAQLTLNATADVTEMVSLRDELRRRWGERITYNDLIVKAVALALRQHPLLNSTLAGEEIVLLHDIDIGIAVALEDGLIVPVVRAADKKSVRTIHRDVRDLAEGAREGTLSVDQVTGGSFTLTSLGAFGVSSFTPIINQPQVAILGVGEIAQEPGVVGGHVVPRWRMTLSLTVDHRIVDGAPGAAFLQTVVGFLEHPGLVFAAETDAGDAGAGG